MIGASTIIVPTSSCGGSSATSVGSAATTREMFGPTATLRRDDRQNSCERIAHRDDHARVPRRVELQHVPQRRLVLIVAARAGA